MSSFRSVGAFFVVMHFMSADIEIAIFLRPEHEIQITRAIRSARAESTLRMYASAVRQFSAWTGTQRVP